MSADKSYVNHLFPIIDPYDQTVSTAPDSEDDAVTPDDAGTRVLPDNLFRGYPNRPFEQRSAKLQVHLLNQDVFPPNRRSVRFAMIRTVVSDLFPKYTLMLKVFLF